MRKGFLVALLVTAACSRQPQEAYSNAWTAFREGRLEQAQKMVDAALPGPKVDPPPKGAVPLRLLKAEILLAQSHAGDAGQILESLPEPNDQTLRLRWLVDRAEAWSKQDHDDKAAALLDQVDRSAAESTGDAALKSLLLRGRILARGDHLAAAEEVLGKAADRAARAGDRFNRAAALINLSSCKILEDRFDESLEYSQSALTLAQQDHASRLAAMANDNLGVAYGALGDLDRSAEHQNNAIEQLRRIGDLRNLTDSTGSLGYLYLRRHEPSKAVTAFQQAVELAREIGDADQAGKWAGRTAYALTELHQWPAAESWNQKAYDFYRQLRVPAEPLFLTLNKARILQGLGIDREAEGVYAGLVTAAERDDPFIELNARLGLGELLAAGGRPKEANAQYDQGIAFIQRTADSLIRDEYRFSYYDLQTQFFKEYVDLLVREGQDTQALRVAEFSRARVLAQRLRSRTREISQIQPSRFERYAKETHSVLLSYWLGPARSFVWVVKADGIQTRVLPGEDKIRGLVAAFRRMVEDELRDPVAAKLPEAEQLSQALLGPIQGDLGDARRVVVIPDGGLYEVNLETLPAPGRSRYWIQDVEVSIAPSLSLLETADPPGNGSHGKPAVLLIGAPAQASPDYPALPAAESEVEQIARLFSSAEVHTGAGATPDVFLRSDTKQFSLIHFAAHAEVNSQSPLDSAVILSKESGSGDYKLYARDIAARKLSAELVTLSACRSAGSRTYEGEGPVGFTWAFLEAGAHAVIAGLWEVGDRSSAEIMSKMYQGLAAGSAPAAALRQAKLALLNSSSSYRKPFYWGPYQVYVR